MRAAFLAALLLISGLAVAEEVVFGMVQIVAIHGKRMSDKPPSHEEHFNLLLNSGELRRVLFPKEPSKLPATGSYVMVKTLPLTACGVKKTGHNSTLCAASLMAHEEAPRDSWAYGQPRGNVSMKVLVMQIDVCGQGVASDYNTIMKTLWSDVPGHQDYTVQSMFSSCSHQSASFSQSLGSKVLQVTVPVPCEGTTPFGVPYDGWTCPYNEFSDMANQYVTNTLNISLKDYKYKIYIVPKGNLCNWGGMGYVGCVDDCRAWINGDLVEEPTAYLHELGHNLYLNHAGKNGDGGYGDMSSTMGFCCDIRCYNAPHSFQLGWHRPMAILHKGNMPSGTWISYRVPASIISRDNFVRVRPDWTAAGAATNLFISYRKTLGYDAGLPADAGLPVDQSFGNKVLVHSTPAGDSKPFTSWEMSIGPGQLWKEGRLGSGLAIRVFGYEGNNAIVGLCRPESRTETSCGDKKDNDCDAFVDAADPDCQKPAAVTAAVARARGLLGWLKQ